jgi:hypothetical protein
MKKEPCTDQQVQSSFFVVSRSLSSQVFFHFFDRFFLGRPHHESTVNTDKNTAGTRPAIRLAAKLDFGFRIDLF